MKKRPLAIASAGAFVSTLSTSLVAVSVPVIANDFASTAHEASWVLSSYLLAISCLLALAGKAADVLGRKRVYLTGFVFFIAGSAMCASAPALKALIGARVLQGVGAALLMAVSPAIVTSAAAPKERARALGIQLGTMYIGLTLGPGLGGMLAGRIGWQAVFVVTAGAAAAALACSIVFLDPDDRTQERPGIGSLDLGGAALFAVGLAALLIALKRTQQDGWTNGGVLAIGGFALVTLGVFARHEALHRTPLVPLELFAKRDFSLGVLGAVLLYTITSMLSYLLPFHLQRAGGLAPARAGAFMMAQPAVMAVVAPFSGVLADRWGPRFPSTAGMLAIGGGLFGVARTGSSPGLGLVLSLGLVGIGAGLYVAPNSSLIMGAAPRERQATAGAMAATARNIGMTLGVAIAASMYQALGFGRSLYVATAVGIAGAVLGAVR